MNYILNSKNRKFKFKLHLLFDRLSFNFLNLETSQKIAALWIIISIVALFMNWSIIEYDGIKKSTAFSIRSWYVWFIISLSLIFVSFIILSNKNKEKLKTKAHIVFYDYTLIIFVWILVLLLSVVTFNSIRWFSTFTNSVKAWNWIAFEIIWSIFIILWWIMAYREKKQEILSKVYIENSKFEVHSDLEEYKDILGQNKAPNKSNMSLPI